MTDSCSVSQKPLSQKGFSLNNLWTGGYTMFFIFALPYICSFWSRDSLTLSWCLTLGAGFILMSLGRERSQELPHQRWAAVTQKGWHHHLPLPQTGLENESFTPICVFLGKESYVPLIMDESGSRDREVPLWRPRWGTWALPAASDTAVLILGLNLAPLLTQHSLALVGAHWHSSSVWD